MIKGSIRRRLGNWQARLVIGLITALAAQPVLPMLALAQQPAQEPISRDIRRAPPGSITKLPDPSKRWAFIVGVNKYDIAFDQLEGAENDANRLADSLIKNAGFLPNHVTRLSTDRESTWQPRRAVIINALVDVLHSVPQDGLFLFAFSGHGVELEVKGTKQNFLLPMDAARNDLDSTVMTTTSIEMDEIKGRIKNRGIKQVIMLIDSCRSDPTAAKGVRSVANNLVSEDYLSRFNFDERNSPIEAFVVLLASSAGQRAYEYPKAKMGFFTWAIVQALACEDEGREACNEKGQLTLGGLKRYLQQKIPDKVRDVYGVGVTQKPMVFESEGYLADELVLASVPRASGNKSSSVTAASPEIDRGYWRRVKEKNLLDDYLEYRKFFPNGEFVEEARQNIARFEPIYWTKAESTKNPADYQLYLDYFSKGPHAAEANSFLAAEHLKQQEETDWKQAKQENTYSLYLKDYPNGKYAGEAGLALANMKKSEEDQRENDDWKQAVSSNNIAGYQAYLKQYPQGRFGVDANRTIGDLRKLEEERREKDAWELAKKSQSIAGYQAYLKDFQNGSHAADANAALTVIKEREELARRLAQEDAAWEKAKNNGSFPSYQEYLTAYPQGRYVEPANTALGALRLAGAEKRRIEEEDAAWERTKNGASKQSYSDYIGAYPQGRFIVQARQSIAEFVRIEEDQRRLNSENTAWQQAKNANTLVSLHAYLKDYPTGRFVTEARNGIATIERAEVTKVEDAAWQQAQQSASVAAYQIYLTAYPQGRYLNQANSALTEIRRREEQQRLATLENEAWATAQRGATLAAYRTYLAAYPNGSFVTEANKALAEARELEARRLRAAEDASWMQAGNENTLASLQTYLKAYPQGRFALEANDGIAKLNRLDQLKRETATWTRAQQSASVAAYQAYLAEYPQGGFVTEATGAIVALKRAEDAQRLQAAEAAAWKQAQQRANLAGYQAYLRDYPAGRFAVEARKGLTEFERIEEEKRQRSLEDAAWKQAQQGASLKSYQTYMTQYPAGRFVAEANKELATIEDTDWARAQRGARSEDYQSYLTAYPNGRYVVAASNAIAESQRKTEAQRLATLDETAWRRAQQRANATDYQAYLTEYPQGRFAAEANQRVTEMNLAAEAQRVVALDEAAWQQAQQNASSATYQAYLNAYPKGRFATEATRRFDDLKLTEENQRLAALDEAAWASAGKNSSLAAYQAYLTTYPKGRFAIEATNAIAELNRLEAIKREDGVWQQILKDNTLAAYQTYLTDYPTGRYVEPANQRVTGIKKEQALIAADENAWQAAQAGTSLAAYQAYLKDYPNGRYATTANNSIAEISRVEANKGEDQTWEQARNSASLAGYQAYLTAYPNGRFIAEANSAVAEFAKLEASKREEQDWAAARSSAALTAYRAYLTNYPRGRFATEAESLIRVEEAKLEDTTWEQTQKDANFVAFQSYLSAYPNGRFAAEAKIRVAELNGIAGLSATLAAPLTPRVYRYNTKFLKATGEDWERTNHKTNEIAQKLGNQVALEMVEVKGGSFYMGTSNADVTQVLEEYKRNQFDPALAEKLVVRQQPQRKVKVESFYLGKHEITQAQWRAVASLPQVKRDLNPTPSYFKGDDLPVEQVSWEDAVEFCERLSRATGRKYRLPTEAEWEFASRAGSTGAFAFGETLTTQVANYHGGYRYGNGPIGQYRGTTIKPGSLGVANAYGLFDMHGNVSEWVQDSWHDNYKGAPSDGSNWDTGSDERMRVIRGGSWNDRSNYCRSAHRTRYESYLYSNTIGFRVALNVALTGK